MKWTRSRTASALAVGTASALLLSACTAGEGTETTAPTTDAGPKEDITLTLSDWSNFYTPEMLEQYQTDNPHVTIELNSGEFNAVHEALQQQLIAGSGAAMVQAIDSGFMTGFIAQSENFVNLLDLGAGKYQDNYLSWKWADGGTADGDYIIGVGSDVGGMALCYRRDLFEAAGLPTDREDVDAAIGDTWEGFIALGEQYVAATNKPFVDNVGNIITPALTQLQVGWYNRNNELATDQAKPAFDIALAVIEAGLSANIGAWSPEWNTGFETGSFAVLACPSWMLGHITGQISADTFAGQWDVADMPGPGGNWGGSYYTIPNQHSDYEIQEAWAFIEWVIQPEQQIAIMEAYGNLPSQSSLYDDPRVGARTNAFFNDAPVGSIFTKSANDIPGPVYYGPKHQTVANAVGSVLGEVEAGNISIADAWDAAVAAAEAADAA
ncbi:MAG: ABC transporter substrate-binding protein [Actinobacteria bacterium HGW-Actinobacteria-4]|nr:MAG: ABC transporter substrate-binding protein [Actinobacteria bacterium HGW-Actinobacteria-4]